ncbi:hypothetical protein ACIBM3_31090 [Rhodococcus erythropolis]|uniref:hypothetical protein n=1 Tax=Rhodococcus erythropolis TaxID=1833 RepID=UPI00379D813B
MTLTPEKMPLKMRRAAEREDFKIRLMNSNPWHWVFAWVVIALVVASPWIYSFVTKPGQEVVGTPVPRWLILTGAAVAPLGAIFTTLGVGVALYVALRDSGRYAKEEARRHSEESARRADQARLIQVTLEWGEMGDSMTGVGTKQLHIYATNHSDRPILDLRPDLGPFKSQLKRQEPELLVSEQVQILHPAQTKMWPYTVVDAADGALLADAADAAALFTDNAFVELDAAINRVLDRLASIGVIFTDAKGVKWKRAELGAPQLMT